MSEPFDAIIVGGGVVGLSAALHLAEAGLRRVLVLERRVLASGGSGLGSGSVHRQRWTATDSALIGRSLAMISRLSEASGGVFRLYPVGRLTLAGAQDRGRVEIIADTLKDLGVPARLVSGDEIVARYPGVTVADVGIGLVTEEDGVLYPPALVWALAGTTRAAGVVIWEGCAAARIAHEAGRVQGVQLDNGQMLASSRVILAAGVWSRRVMQASGLDLSMAHSVTHATVVTVGNEAEWHRIPSLLDGIQGLIAIPRNPGTIICATVAGEIEAGADLAGETLATPTVEIRNQDAAYLAQREEHFRAALVLAQHRFASCDIRGVAGGWAGLLDATADGHPLVGPVTGVAGLWVGCGLAGYGVQRGPGVGEALAQMALGQPTTVDVAHYEPMRFAAGRQIAHDPAVDNPLSGFRRL